MPKREEKRIIFLLEPFSSICWLLLVARGKLCNEAKRIEMRGVFDTDVILPKKARLASFCNKFLAGIEISFLCAEMNHHQKVVLSHSARPRIEFWLSLFPP